MTGSQKRSSRSASSSEDLSSIIVQEFTASCEFAGIAASPCKNPLTISQKRAGNQAMQKSELSVSVEVADNMTGTGTKVHLEYEEPPSQSESVSVEQSSDLGK